MGRLASVVSAVVFMAVAFGAGWVFGWKWSAQFEATHPDFATDLYMLIVLLASHTIEYLILELIELIEQLRIRTDGNVQVST